MKNILRNSLAIISGILLGSVVNGFIINISRYIIPPPKGADVTTLEGVKNTMHLFEPKHFLMPFLAHALGTFVGAALCTLLAISHHKKFAIIIGVLFMMGGIANVYMLPSPVWFACVDIIGAYIPMALLGYKLINKGKE